jgi:hypothetical protein
MDPQRRWTDHSDASEVRLTLVERGLADHQAACDARQKEIKEMFLEIKGDIAKITDRLNAMQFGWMAAGLGLLGSAAVFLFGKVMKWW